MSFDPILLTPEAQQEDIYPFRRVWRTSSIEAIILFVVVAAIYVATAFAGVAPPSALEQPGKIGLALLPLGTWMVFSYWGERRALQPREGMLGMVVLGALAASGAAIPLEESLFVPDRWLPNQGFFGQVLGYMFTLGFSAEFLKYAVMRYSIWPRQFNQRLDGVAYAMAVATGFALVLNLRIALDIDVTLQATALRVASITLSHVAIGVIAGAFLAELKIGRPPIFWVPMGLLIAAAVSGLYYAFRNVAVVGSLSIASTGYAPLRGLLLAGGLMIVVYAISAFVIESADTRMEALTGRRQTI